MEEVAKELIETILGSDVVDGYSNCVVIKCDKNTSNRIIQLLNVYRYMAEKEEK